MDLWKLTCVLSGFVLGFIAGITAPKSDAACRRVTVVKQRAVVVQPVVAVTPVTVATFVPVPVPQYSISYSSDQAQLESLRAEVVKLRAQVAALSQQPGPAPPAPDKPLPYLALMQAKCASCHEAGVAQAKGGSYVLFNGKQLRPLTDQDKVRILSRVNSNDAAKRMPKNAPGLTDAEFTTLLDVLEAK